MRVSLTLVKGSSQRETPEPDWSKKAIKMCCLVQFGIFRKELTFRTFLCFFCHMVQFSLPASLHWGTGSWATLWHPDKYFMNLFALSLIGWLIILCCRVLKMLICSRLPASFKSGFCVSKYFGYLISPNILLICIWI